MVGDWERETMCGDKEREYRNTVNLSLTFPLLGCFSREKVTPAQDGQHK